LLSLPSVGYNLLEGVNDDVVIVLKDNCYSQYYSAKGAGLPLHKANRF
jgi:hypothetical protein